jgi:hypothetical protein
LSGRAALTGTPCRRRSRGQACSPTSYGAIESGTSRSSKRPAAPGSGYRVPEARGRRAVAGLATHDRIISTFLLRRASPRHEPPTRRLIGWPDRGSSLRLGSSRGHRFCGDRDRSDAASEAMCWSVHGYMSAARGGERLHAFRAELAASLDRDRWWGSACVASARCDKHASRPER